MAIYPGAKFKPLTANKGRRKMAAYNRVNLHVAVSEASSLFGYFNKSGIPDSHFYVRKDGTAEQYVDTRYQAFADRDGNDATISIETQGGTKNPNGEKWTEAQLNTLASIYKWARATHGIRNKIAHSSKVGEESRGLSWHRLGIDGNFPPLPDPRAGRRQRGGGMHYSKSVGKICPGDAKIYQVKEIFARSQAAPPKPKPPTPPKPAPPKPTPAPPGKLVVDGVWGPDTTQALQRYLGTSQDRVVSSQDSSYKNSNPGLLSTTWQWVPTKDVKGSSLILALQKKIGASQDGVAGPGTFKALQKYLGTPQDGVISNPSSAVTEMQKRLNAGTF